MPSRARIFAKMANQWVGERCIQPDVAACSAQSIRPDVAVRFRLAILTDNSPANKNAAPAIAPTPQLGLTPKAL
jgi:hypothetical protein